LWDELCENPPTTLNKVDQRPQDTQVRSGSHDLYHHLTSNSKL
jgi:hypothetical protein